MHRFVVAIPFTGCLGAVQDGQALDAVGTRGGTALTSALPRIEVVEFEDLGHMGPVTRPEVVNAAIKQFLERG